MLALSGQIGRRPGRYADRRNEPMVDIPIGEAPAGLSPEEALIWADLVAYGV
jgi:hypothetical protein